MRVLIDTDITLDFLLKREPFFDIAKNVMRLNAQGAFDGYVSAITPLNIFYVAPKEIGVGNVRQAIEKLLTVVQVCPINAAVLNQAFTLPFNDYEDAVQHASATALQLDAIVTRNIDDYKNATLPIFAPTDFLNQLTTPKE